MPDLESMGSVPLAVAAVALLLAGAAGLGWLVAAPLATRARRGDAALLQMVVGLNLVGLLGLALGAPGWLTAGRSLWLLAGCGLLLGMAAWRHGPPAAMPLRQWSVRIPPLTWCGFAVPLAILAITLGPALCGPTGWDELVYHLVLPRRWLADGRPLVYLDLPYSGFPSLGPILFWLMAPMDSVVAPRLLSWACWVLGLACLWRVLRRRALSRFPAGVLTLAFGLNDIVLMIGGDCYVETILLMNVAGILLAVELPYRQSGSGRTRWARAAVLGVLAGGAASVKLTGGAVLAVPILWYLCEAWRAGRRWRAVTGHMALAAAIAAAVCLPFYLRPWLATGNPFYPYFCGWFLSDPGRLEMSGFHHAIGGAAFGVKSIAGFVAAPLLLAFRPGTYDGKFGWQLLAFVGLAVVAAGSCGRARVRYATLWPAAVGVWLYTFWFVTAQQARFAVCALLGLTLVAAAGLRLLHGWPRRAALAIVGAATLLSVPWQRSGYYWYSWQCAAGRLSRTDYLHTATGGTYLPLVQAVSERTPPEARLLLLLEHRGLYLARWSRIGTPLFQEAFFAPLDRYADAAAIMDVLRQNGITHVVLAKALAGPDQAPNAMERRRPFFQALSRCVHTGRLRVDWETREYALLEVGG